MSSSARIDELRRKFDENPRRYFAPLANEYRKAGDFDQAIFICQEYLPQQPGHMSGHIVFGQALFEAKRLPEAKTVFETALTLDPENLIALRHLADISRGLGDFDAARTWYERVLQADPRNEEIAAIMASMASPAASPPGSSPSAPTAETPARSTSQPTAPPAAAPVAAAAAPTMELSAAAVQEMVKARQAAQAAAQPVPDLIPLDAAPTIEIDVAPAAPTVEGFESTRSEETFDIPSGGMLGLEPTSVGAPPPDEAPAATTIPDGIEAISLDDFSVPSAPPPKPTPAPEAPAAADTEGLLDLDNFGFETPTSPVSAAPDPGPSTPAIETDLAGTMDFELDIPAVTTPERPPSPPQSLDSIDTVVMEAIPDIEATAIPEAIPDLPSLEIADIPAVAPQEVGPTVIMEAIKLPRSEPPDLPPAETSAARPPFVTETMAQLYLEQGHRAEALDIYRQLVAARPNDESLRARFESLEKNAARPEPAPPTLRPVESQEPAGAAAPAPVPSRFTAGGPTIREVLRDLFGVDAQANGNGAQGADPGGDVGSIDLLFSAQAVADAPSSLAVAFDGGYVATSGTIDAVFVGGSS